MALLPPFRAMTARGLRVHDALRRERIAALSEEGARLAVAAQPIVEGVLDKLKRRDLVEWWQTCKVCHNGKRKRLTCSACNALGRARIFSFNLASEKQLKDALYEGLKLPVRSRDRRITTDEEALESLLALDKSGLVALALRHSKLDTMRSIYERLAPAPDGAVRTVLNPAGTYTGRPNSSEAFYVPHSTNLHNLPAQEARADTLFAVRDCIVPDAGEVFVYADLSQAEARIVAALSQDERLLAGWARDPEWDVHTWTATRILKRDQVSAEERQTCGKRPRHALNYGMGPGKFWRVLNAAGAALTRKETDAIYKGYHALHPNLDGVWWSDVERALEERGFIETVFGRRLNFYPRFDPFTGSLDPETLRAAIAAEPQSTVADLTNRAVVALWALEERGAFRLLHHALDAILVGCSPGRVATVARLLKEGLEWEIVVSGTHVTVPAQVYVAPRNWSTLERIL